MDKNRAKVGDEFFHFAEAIKGWRRTNEFSTYVYVYRSSLGSPPKMCRNGKITRYEPGFNFIPCKEIKDSDKGKLLRIAKALGYIWENGGLNLITQKGGSEPKVSAEDFLGLLEQGGNLRDHLGYGLGFYVELRLFRDELIQFEELVETVQLARKLGKRDVGQKVFVISKAVEDWSSSKDFDKFVYTVKNASGEVLELTRVGEIKTEFVAQERTIPCNFIKNKDEVMRTAKVIGYLIERKIFPKMNHPTKHGYLDHEPLRTVFLHLPRRRKRFFDDLNEMGLEEVVCGYINGKYDFDLLKSTVNTMPPQTDGNRLTSDEILKAAREGVSSVGDGEYEPEEKRGYRKNIKSAEIKLPNLRTIEEIRRFVQEIFRKAKAKIYGQDSALQSLIISFTNYMVNNDTNSPMLLSGPTGTGKTYSLETLAGLLELPFKRIVLPDVTPVGYKGPNMQKVFADSIDEVVNRYGGYPSRLILQVDEFDKILRKGGEFTPMLQDELLKILEPRASLTVQNWSPGNDETRVIPVEAMLALSGAFSFLEKETPPDGINRAVLSNAGFIDELIGRIGSIVVLKKLGKDDYMAMLSNQKLALFADYKPQMDAMGVSVSFNMDAIEFISEIAVEGRYGARYVSSTVTDVFERLQKVLLFADSIERTPGLDITKKPAKKLHVDVRKAFIRRDPKDRTKDRKVGFVK
jgi:ATP-dependent Clp protease ATP-binding subunit ClpX